MSTFRVDYPIAPLRGRRRATRARVLRTAQLRMAWLSKRIEEENANGRRPRSFHVDELAALAQMLEAYVAAVEDPGGVEDRLVDGTVTPEDAEAMRSVYPERMAEIKLPEQFVSTFEKAPQLTEDVGQALAAWSAGGAPPASMSLAELLAAYAACSDAATQRSLREARGSLWHTLSTADQERVRAAAEDANERVAASLHFQDQPCTEGS